MGLALAAAGGSDLPTFPGSARARRKQRAPPPSPHAPGHSQVPAAAWQRGRPEPGGPGMSSASWQLLLAGRAAGGAAGSDMNLMVPGSPHAKVCPGWLLLPLPSSGGARGWGLSVPSAVLASTRSGDVVPSRGRAGGTQRARGRGGTPHGTWYTVHGTMLHGTWICGTWYTGT